MKHKSIRRTKHKHSGHTGKHSGHTGKRSGRTGKRSGRKQSTKRKRSSIKRRLYSGGDNAEVPPYTPSGGTQKGALGATNAAGAQQAGQNSNLRGGGNVGTNCNPDYVAINKAGYCDIGAVTPQAASQIGILLQAKEYARFDVPKV